MITDDEMRTMERDVAELARRAAGASILCWIAIAMAIASVVYSCTR